jgi:hypothetical protein
VLETQAFPSLLILSTLKTETTHSAETSFLRRPTLVHPRRRHFKNLLTVLNVRVDQLLQLGTLFAGRRRKLLERCLYHRMGEATKRELSQLSQPKSVQEYRTEYAGALGVPDFIPSMDNIPQDSEVFSSRNRLLFALGLKIVM